MTMMQDPEEADYDGITRAALMTRTVDFSLLIKDMPPALLNYLKHPYVERTAETPALDQEALEGSPASAMACRVKRNDGHVSARFMVEPLKEPGREDGSLLVSFFDEASAPEPPADITEQVEQGAEEHDLVRQLENELVSTREELQSTIEQSEPRTRSSGPRTKRSFR